MILYNTIGATVQAMMPRHANSDTTLEAALLRLSDRLPSLTRTKLKISFKFAKNSL